MEIIATPKIVYLNFRCFVFVQGEMELNDTLIHVSLNYKHPLYVNINPEPALEMTNGDQNLYRFPVPGGNMECLELLVCK